MREGRAVGVGDPRSAHELELGVAAVRGGAPLLDVADQIEEAERIRLQAGD